MKPIMLRYLQTTFDGTTGEFGAATTLIGPFEDDDTFDKVLAELNQKRRELLPGWPEEKGENS